MTKRITAKMSFRLFKPLLDELDAEDALGANYNDLVAKCVFWCYLNKDRFPKGPEILVFLRHYKRFKNRGVQWLQNSLNRKL